MIDRQTAPGLIRNKFSVAPISAIPDQYSTRCDRYYRRYQNQIPEMLVPYSIMLFVHLVTWTKSKWSNTWNAQLNPECTSERHPCSRKKKNNPIVIVADPRKFFRATTHLQIGYHYSRLRQIELWFYLNTSPLHQNRTKNTEDLVVLAPRHPTEERITNKN